MTSVGVSTSKLQPSGAGASVGSADPRALLSPTNIAMGLLLLAGFAAFFYDWFLRQHRWSSTSEDWSHAYIVPLVSGYLIFRRRHEIARLAPTVFWPGLLPLLVGVACYYLFTLANYEGVHLFQGLSLVLCVAGVSMLLLGPRMFAYLAIPIGYLALGITLPDRFMILITFQLQLLASQGAWVLLNLIGLNVDLAGNTLTIITSQGVEVPLNVAEACSGMRMVIAFLALGIAVAFLSCSLWWQRFALILLAAPVALLTNVVRVASLGVASLWNPDLATGDAHMLIGILWLLPAFLAYMGIVWALKQIVREPEADGAKIT
ncbi:MAG: exosortase/archaeosortase family protein [Phycisphaerales bacterium]|nr:MAG: exosortase/archaeosortase family protein [Phycisphaerales bacterium]